MTAKIWFGLADHPPQRLAPPARRCGSSPRDMPSAAVHNLLESARLKHATVHNAQLRIIRPLYVVAPHKAEMCLSGDIVEKVTEMACRRE
jgi:hypothetical protein